MNTPANQPTAAHVNISSSVTADAISAGATWTDEGGVTHGVLRLGASGVTFHDPAAARKAAAELLAMADAMDEKIARAQW
jgi:hypothetical protein